MLIVRPEIMRETVNHPAESHETLETVKRLQGNQAIADGLLREWLWRQVMRRSAIDDSRSDGRTDGHHGRDAI